MSTSRLGAGIASIALAAVVGVIGAHGVHAHGSEPTGSNPAAGAQLDSAPERISVTFPEDIRQAGAALSVLSPDGVQLVSGTPKADGPSLTAPLKESTESGTYTVAFFITFVDGATLKNKYTFSVSPQDETESGGATPGAKPTRPGPASHESSTTSAPGAPSENSPAPEGTGTPGSAAALIVAGTLLVAIAAVLGFTFARRKKK